MSRWIAAVLLGAVLVGLTGLPRKGHGQGASKKNKGTPLAQVRALDQQAERMQQEFLSGLEQLAQDYEQAGQTDRARAMLEELLKLNPGHEGARERIKAYDEQVFADNVHEVEVDASYGWTTTGVAVSERQAVRIKAAGSYKFIVNETLGPDGFPTANVVTEMADVPAGALVGVVIPPPAPDARPGEAPEPGRPFLIGAAREVSPERNGVLYLKLNTPPGSKCIGKIRVTLAGNIRRASE